MKKIAVRNKDIQIIYPVHLNPKIKNPTNKILKNINNIFLLEPQDYLAFCYLMEKSYIVLTDSGGIQEESTFFGVHCLTVRENTERPITTTLGTNKLIGIDYEIIHEEVDLVLAGNSKEHTIPDLWDGKAANRISKIIDDYFKNI